MFHTHTHLTLAGKTVDVFISGHVHKISFINAFFWDTCITKICQNIVKHIYYYVKSKKSIFEYGNLLRSKPLVLLSTNISSQDLEFIAKFIFLVKFNCKFVFQEQF